MRLIYTVLFCFLISLCNAQRNPFPRIDSLAQVVKAYEKQNEDLKRDLETANEKFKNYSEMYERQWSLFAWWTGIIGTLLTLAALLSISQFYFRMNRHGKKIGTVESIISELNLKQQELNSNILLRIHEIHEFIQHQTIPYSGFFRVKIVSEAILANYHAHLLNPTLNSVKSTLLNTIGRTYNAIEIIRNLATAYYFGGEGSSFTGKEYGISDLQGTLQILVACPDEEIKAQAAKALEELNKIIYTLIVETAKSKEQS